MRSCPKAVSADGKLVLEHWISTLSCMVPALKSLQSNKSGTHIWGCVLKIAHFMLVVFFVCLFEVIELFLLYLPLFTHLFSLLVFKEVSFVQSVFFTSHKYYQVLWRQPRDSQNGSSKQCRGCFLVGLQRGQEGWAREFSVCLPLLSPLFTVFWYYFPFHQKCPPLC